MTRQVRLITVTLTIEVDADQVDALPDVDGFMMQLGESQIPISGMTDFGYRMTDACISGAFKLLSSQMIKAILNDADTKIGDRVDERHSEDWFY